MNSKTHLLDDDNNPEQHSIVNDSSNFATIKGVKNSYMKPRIVVFIPAHNEEKAIRDCLEGLADQELPYDVEMDVFVIADNCTDNTVEKANEAGMDLNLHLNVLITKNNKQRKVGALNTAWKTIYGDSLDIYFKSLSPYQELYKDSIKAILGMDADSRLAPNALLHLWEGLMSARNIGGVMAKYTMRMPRKKNTIPKDAVNFEELVSSGRYGGPITRWWTHQQKQDMAAWLLDLQYRGGSTYVLGGQATLFRPEALQNIVESNKLDGPWQNDSDVEDMLLTWQLQNNGWKTLISPKARCFVDSMKSYHTFRQQRNKWQSGTVHLLTSKDINVKSRHNAKLWRMQLKLFQDFLVRVLFISLLVVSCYRSIPMVLDLDHTYSISFHFKYTTCNQNPNGSNHRHCISGLTLQSRIIFMGQSNNILPSLGRKTISQ
ncbi:MAG TPA: glycosyltransferase family 2 protein [Ureibacillus sp.]|nr:glycosyltransferase family 2 protein [Ureibacillus sp.]